MKRIAAALLVALAAAAQTNVARFLEQNRQALAPNQFDPKLLDFRDKQIILFGESHGIAINEDLDLAFLKYLHREAGVRIYLSEMGYSAGLLLNAYLETGSEDLLNFLMRQAQGTVGWTKERRDFWVKLREWNSSLPRTDRVRIVGIDVEHQRGLALKCLDGLIRSTRGKASDAIAPAVAKLSAAGDRVSDQSLVAGELAASFRDHRADYEALLLDRFFDFELVLTNLQKAIDYYAERNTEKSYETRERAIYDTFLKVYSRAGGGRWYGRWGSFHVLQRPSENRSRFADFLNQPGSPVAGKVASILAMYKDSEALMVPGYRKITVSGEPVPLGPFDLASQGQITLFRLTGAESPFAKSLSGYFGGSAAPAEVVQYVLLVKNATPSHTFEEVPAAFEELPAVVVRSIPEAGSRDVPLSLSEVRVTFSKEMQDRSWSWCTAGAFEPPPLKNVHYDADHRTVVGSVKLEAGKKYAIWLNTAEGCSSFRDKHGRSAVPYLLSFETAAK